MLLEVAVYSLLSVTELRFSQTHRQLIAYHIC